MNAYIAKIDTTLRRGAKKYNNHKNKHAEQHENTILCGRGHANEPEPDVLKRVVCKNEHGAKARTPLCKKSIFERSGFA